MAIFTLNAEKDISYNPRNANIPFNTKLAKKPPVCPEYIIVHELAHLTEPSHSAHFIALMDFPDPKDLFEGRGIHA